MCARRFLFVVFLLILIAVGAAFAIFEYGDRALTRLATPHGHFQQPPPRSGPDYALPASWVARPDMNARADPALWRPEGAEPLANDPRRAAVFYIHPTTYLDTDRWNGPADDTGEAGQRARLFVRSQASAFNAVGEIWAPRYRQAAYGAFLLTTADATKALDLAYRDVLAAFDAFLAVQPADRPLILAGHSQGSLHLSRMLAERRDRLQGRLVAAYVVGWPLSVTADLPAMGLSPCTAPDQLGCVLSWQSFAEPANPALIVENWSGTVGLNGAARDRVDMLCTNPLTGTRDGAAHPAANRGTLIPDGDLTRASIEPGRVGAHCDRGILILDGSIPPLGPYVLPGNNYHVYDYALFWGSIAADAKRRLNTWPAR